MAMTKMTQSLISRISLRATVVFLGALLCGFAVAAQSIVELQPTTSVSVDPTRKSPVGLTSTTTEDNGGLSTGGYLVKQTAEVGGRISDFSGNELMWDTLVNLGSGVRLLEYSLNLHSPKHNGLLFDDLSFSNFGYGGDPDDLTRLRLSKGKIYNFEGNFRRDRNVFDYNLLANPLNPATSVPDVPILDSPHQLFLTRRMSDYNLNLFPLSIVRFRLGYSHNIQQGTAFSSVHEGTEAQLVQPTLNITDNYHFGVSVRALPRTSLNYDQFYTFTKGDSASTLYALPYNLAGTQPIPVDLGLSINMGAGQPCAAPILGTGFVNPLCNAFFSYNRSGRNRVQFPAEQASFQSSYFPWMDLAGRFSYSKSENDLPAYDELFSGLITRTRQRSYTTTGSSSAERLSVTGDFAATIHVSDHFRIVDDFRYDNFRIPGAWLLNTSSLFGATLLSTPNVFNPATCPPPFTAATCPQHNASSPADVVADAFSDFLRQERKVNTFELEYDFTRRINAFAGYRYESRDITDSTSDVQLQTFYPTLATRGCAGQPIQSDGSCMTTVTSADGTYVPIQAHSLIAGVSARVTDTLRLRFDTELYYADNAFTRISPRHLQRYRLRTTYQPVDWVNLSGGISILENRNTALDIGNLQHNRSYSIAAEFASHEGKWGVDLSYDYNDIFSQTNICYVATPSPVGALSCGAPFLSGISLYAEKAHFGSGSVFVRPMRKLTATLGYTVTSSDGNTLILDPDAPSGPLTYRYHVPVAGIAYEVSKGFTFKTNWNYYDYKEYSDVGPTLPRNFRGNVVTVSIRYAL
jgi:hypothetical protein